MRKIDGDRKPINGYRSVSIGDKMPINWLSVGKVLIYVMNNDVKYINR